jgi:rubrerythrin
MTPLKFLKIGLISALMLSLIGLSNSFAEVSSAQAVKSSKTLENLIAAYTGESNAKARYEEFAKKADEEGYMQVASLFRAVAAAEAIHINNHREIISKLSGSAPKIEIGPTEVKSTKENLEAAMKGEIYERDMMYPEFIKEARESKNMAAVRSFNFAKLAETEHVKLYFEAVNNSEAWKAAKKTFYVCPVCGYTTATLLFQKCPVCFTDVKKFKPVE